MNSLLDYLHHVPEWGTIPAYFGGIALIGTVYTIMKDHQRTNREQAAKVAAWVSREQTPRGTAEYFVRVRNASDLPVTNVWVATVVEKGSVKLRFRKDGAPEGPTTTRHHYAHVLPPGDTWSPTADEGWNRPAAVVQMHFTDSAGKRWIRTRKGLEPTRKSGHPE